MKIRHFIRITAFCVAAVCMITFMTSFFKVNNARDVMGMYSFYKEPENSIDVALIGPSQIYTGFYSPLAYRDYGFTSYALSTAGMPASLYIPAIKEMERLQKPKLYVFEVWGFFEESVNKGFCEGSVRKFVDNMAESPNKQDTIEQIVPGDKQITFKYPILKYHSMWTKLPSCIGILNSKIKISKRGYSLTKNFSTTTRNATKDSKSEIDDLIFDDTAMGYLKQVLDYCKDNNMDQVLFVRFPDLCKKEDKKSFESAQKLIESYGYTFLNMNNHKKEMGLKDFSDYYNYDHVNVYGFPKTTKYLSNYIVSNYDVKAEHTEQVKKEWDECAKYTDKVIDYCTKMIELKNTRECYFPDDFRTVPQAPAKKGGRS